VLSRHASKQADRVVVLQAQRTLPGGTFFASSFGEYQYLSDRARTVQIVATTTDRLPLGTSPGQSERGAHELKQFADRRRASLLEQTR
jgi:hypothetical protein